MCGIVLASCGCQDVNHSLDGGIRKVGMLERTCIPPTADKEHFIGTGGRGGLTQQAH